MATKILLFELFIGGLWRKRAGNILKLPSLTILGVLFFWM